ncbi:GroES-like protein [Daedaleopsis nitida]|nr:GroES-like protein [Daedaleopsis nitida]
MAPSTQKALVVPEPGQPWKVVADWPVPTPGPQEVLVRIMAAGLNPADWKIQTYAPSYISDYPFIGGLDGAGIVEDVGDAVSNVAKGDKILFPGDFNKLHATFQQYNVVPADNVAKIPDNVTFDEAASVSLALATVLAGIWSQHPQATSIKLTPPWEDGGMTKYAGQPALVLGGSSSVGQYALQMAKLQRFAPIITTASPKHAEHLKSLGATHILDRALSPDALLAALRTLTAEAPLVYAFDAISTEETQSLAYSALAPGGALVATNPVSGLFPAVQVMVDRDRGAGHAPKTIVRTSANLAIPGSKALGEEMFKRLTEWLATGVVVPNRVEVLPGGLAGIPEGCARMRDNKVSGTKLVVRPQETV